MAADPRFPPRLYLIGAQKCATTFLAECLAGHPAIRVAAPKEPDFFTRHYPLGLDWYRRCFPADGGELWLDASTSYAVAPSAFDPANPLCGVPERIRALRPDARLVYVVRDPVERVHSAYWHAVGAGDETRPFADAIASDPWYLDASRYHHQLRSYLAVFPADRLLVLDMRTLVADPCAAAARICRHAGLADGPAAAPTERPRNASYRLTGIGRVLAAGAVGRDRIGRDRLRRAAGLARAVLPAPVYDRIRRGVTRGLPEMSAAHAELVRRHLGDDTQRFEALTGVRFAEPAAAEPASPAGRLAAEPAA